MAGGIGRREFLIAGGVAGASAAASSRSLSPHRIKASQIDAVDLKIDYLERPLGLENRCPQFSWRLESDARNVWQEGYRIRVASSKAYLEAGRSDLWDTGFVRSSKTFGIRYRGRELKSRQRCWWAVQVFDTTGGASAPSAPTWWEMGLLEERDWIAQWLAVEDDAAKADRETGLHWIWAGSVNDMASRKFRLSFELPVASSGGELLAITNDWNWWAQISRIWLDGRAVAGHGVWIHPFERSTATSRDRSSLSTQHIRVPPLTAGKHLIAVEVNVMGSGDLGLRLKDLPYVPGLALFARLMLENEEVLRISGERTKASLASDEVWYEPEYDDGAWRPAHRAAIEDYQPWPATPAMHLRREFKLEKALSRARLYATALGAYEARINGQRVSDALLTPEVSQYAKRVLYRVFDVTALLQQGSNVLGFTVGDGWYGNFDGRFAWAPPPRRVLGQLELAFADGSQETITTGPGWRIAPSPILVSHIKAGELYDGRREQPGWDSKGFDDANWQEAGLADPPHCRVVAQTSPPIRIIQTFKPERISETRPGVYVVDFRENFTGWCRLWVKGDEGAQITLTFGELLTETGEVDQSNMQDPHPALPRDRFILKGDPSGEVLEPHFSYRGFRYVQIEGMKQAPTPDAVEGVFVHTDLPLTGQLRSSSPLIEQIWRNTLQSQRSNFVSIPTDNTMREWRGWMNDAAGVFWDAASFNMDVCAFTARFMDNVVDDQATDGAFPMVTPEPKHNNAYYNANGSPPGWGDAGIILPWTVWRRYGDLGIIERNWEPMNRHLQFIHDHNPDLIWRYRRSIDFGDWLEGCGFDSSEKISKTPKDLIGTAYWAYSADLLAQMAEATGRMEDVTRLRRIFERVRHAFNQAFVYPDGTIGTGTQTGYVLALKFNLLPQQLRQQVADRLAAALRSRGVALTTGVLGTQFILDVLADAGYASLAYDVLLRTEHPSWGYMFREGATTIWDTWNGKYQGFLGSRNQYAFGSVVGFLFRRIAGIDAASPGFERVVIRPVLDPRVKQGGGDYDSVMGRITSNWRQTTDGGFRLELTIPPNVLARVHLPTAPGNMVKEGRRDVSVHRDLRVITRSNTEVIVEAGSGDYSFVVEERAKLGA